MQGMNSCSYKILCKWAYCYFFSTWRTFKLNPNDECLCLYPPAKPKCWIVKIILIDSCIYYIIYYKQCHHQHQRLQQNISLFSFFIFTYNSNSHSNLRLKNEPNNWWMNKNMSIFKLLIHKYDKQNVSTTCLIIQNVINYIFLKSIIISTNNI